METGKIINITEAIMERRTQEAKRSFDEAGLSPIQKEVALNYLIRVVENEFSRPTQDANRRETRIQTLLRKVGRRNAI